MAFLTPDNTRIFCGVTVKEKIIPDGAVWQKDSGSYKKGTKYKAEKLLSGGTGEVKYVTIHNTGRITHSSQTTAAEQYTRATWPNCNMNDVRVHYYVDAVEAWQNLKENEVGWHSGDGNTGPGNGTTIAIECIMNGSGDEEDLESEDNCARLAAGLLLKYGLTHDELVSHYKWSKLKGGSKYCPAYILPHWDEFKAKVKDYMDQFRAEDGDSEQTETEESTESTANATETPSADTGSSEEATGTSSEKYVPAVGDEIKILPDAERYYPGGSKIPQWVKQDYTHTITQILFRSNPVVKGGKTCVLLGKKTAVGSTTKVAGINTWIDQELIQKI